VLFDVIDMSSVPEEKEDEKPKEKKDKGKEKKDKRKEKKEEENLLAIKAKKSENFAEWYTDVIVKAEMIEYYDISGCYILRPWAYQIWERIQMYFDDLIKLEGVENAYFPLFVSEKSLCKEKDHVEGFTPEVAWVTQYGDKKLENKIAIRPTSETIMYPAYSKWIRSHRDLPLKLNQWSNVVRWEFKNPTPFIRTREFLWQEGHTAHATKEDASDFVFKILSLYQKTYEDLLAIPVIPGIKSENEKFAGADFTTTVECFVLENGRGVQAATSHGLGQNFSKMFDIKYLDQNQKEQYVWQTSWGLTTRSIGILIMVHGDDKGLVLPPRVAPIQVILIPIITSKDNPEIILSKVKEYSKLLSDADVRNKIDDRDCYNPGWKYSHWEQKGVPLRLEFGAKDLTKGTLVLVCRDNGERITITPNEIQSKSKELLETIQKRMLENYKNQYNCRIQEAKNFDEFLKTLSEQKVAQTPWCKQSKCEEEVKKKVKALSENMGEDDVTNVSTAKTLCMPLNQKALEKDAKCFFCNEVALTYVNWGKSY
jgi:prolyl-tRNA synthetase